MAAAAAALSKASSSSTIFLSALPLIVGRFQRKEGSLVADFVQHIFDEKNGIHFFGIHKKDQMDTSTEKTSKKYTQFKRELARIIGLDPEMPVVQVIGDSVAYSSEGTSRSLKFLETALATDALILYGFTGHEESDGTKCVNAATSHVVTSCGWLARTVGNVVAFHTPTALTSWHCSAPGLEHYIVVYGDDERSKTTGTLFGDDVTTSDFTSDSFFLLEGGVQSFRQVCNALLLGKPVKAINRLRGEKSLGMHKADGLFPYFSAVDFIQYIRNHIEAQPSSVTTEQLNEWKIEYFKTHFLADPERPDYSTKGVLFEEAWKIFLENRLYHRLDLFEITAPISTYITKTVKPEQASIKCYIITGGPGVGKTTLINYLNKEKGEAIVEEAATRIIAEQHAKGVAAPWADGEKFRSAIAALQKADREKIATPALAEKRFFCDRSPVDTFSYAIHLKAAPTDDLVEIVTDSIGRYNPIVFLVENLGLCERTDFRPESLAEALEIEKVLEEGYRALGYRIVRIKPDTIEKRAEAVLATLTAE